jgi:hypothetical protein
MLVRCLAIVLTALALVPGGAHLFALINKIGLPREQYFAVQGIYRGWALLGVVVFGALAANLALALTVRRQRTAFWLAVAGFAGIAVSLLIFFIWTYPANVATGNWTVAPADWRELRIRWEYSHAVNAVITFLALICVTVAGLLPADRSARP